MVKDRRVGPGMPFLDNDNAQEWGGVFISAKPSMMSSMDR
jgi:hypothetical protein